jgi:hypothetical protein
VQDYYAKPYEQNTAYQFHVPSITGKTTGTVNVDYNTPIVLYDYSTGKVAYAGVGFEAAEKAAEMAKGLTAQSGRKAEWGIYTGAPGSTDPSTFKQVAYEKPNQSTFGKIADVAIPAALAFIAPTLLPATAGKTAAGAAAAGGSILGSGISSALQGRDLEEALIRAGISGGLTFGMSQIPGMEVTAGGTIAGNLSKAFSSFLPQKAFTNSLGEIVVAPALSTAITPAVSGALGSGLSNLSKTVTNASGPSSAPPSPDIIDPDIFVTGGLKNFEPSWMSDLMATGISKLGGLNFNTTTPTQQTNQSGVTDDGQEIAVTATRPPVTTPSLPMPGLPNINVPTGPITQPQAVDPDDEIVITGARDRLIDLGLPASFLSSLSAAELNTLAQRFNVDQPTQTTTPEQKTFLQKLRDYYGYGSLGLGALGLLGQALGGKGGSGSSAGATGITSPVFSASLPPPSSGMFGGSGGSFAARPFISSGLDGNRPMTEEDWYTYAMRPERSFFDYVPQGTSTIREPDAPSTGGGGGNVGGGGEPREDKEPRAGKKPRKGKAEKTRAPREPKVRKGLIVEKAMGGYAAGGPRESFTVEGAGTGRSDDIPAVLSDGEYVMDAETVALLGDGSSKAGAKKLDQFRVNVRKHKGKKLARGKFSANAKNPERYMGGGSI